MKLLFDEKLSHKLVGTLADVFPDSEHVRNLGLKAVDDRLVWEYAAANGMIIVSKDSDFYQRSLLFSHPPKVVWIRRGNCSTADISQLVRRHFDDIKKFNEDAQKAFLVLMWSEYLLPAVSPLLLLITAGGLRRNSARTLQSRDSLNAKREARVEHSRLFR